MEQHSLYRASPLSKTSVPQYIQLTKSLLSLLSQGSREIRCGVVRNSNGSGGRGGGGGINCNGVTVLSGDAGDNVGVA